MPLNQKRLLKPVKKLRKLLHNLDSDPKPEQVHDLRTSARRFESAFEALDLKSEGIPKSLRKQLSRLRKRAGKVRDLDVLTAFAATIRPKGEEENQIRLLEHLGARRQKQAGKLYAEVKHIRLDLSKELDKASSVLTKLLRRLASSDSPLTNASATAASLAAQLASPPRLTKANLHPYRLKVKELQDILLMAQSPSRLPFVKDLGEVKNGIGEWHDWEELVAIASKLLKHERSSTLLIELKRIAETKRGQATSLALKLRKSYLQTSKTKAGPSVVPRTAVWDAMAHLAG